MNWMQGDTINTGIAEVKFEFEFELLGSLSSWPRFQMRGSSKCEAICDSWVRVISRQDGTVT
jgi:hypothetical protein